MRTPAIPTPVQEIRESLLDDRGVRVLVKRDDVIHPTIPGNKWRKLKYNLEAARKAGHDTLLTFGGAYSNHIYATASAGRAFDFRTIGVIRGEEHLPLNDVLQHAVSSGMTLTYLDRNSYRRKYDDDVIGPLTRGFGKFYLLPEGGTNCLAVRGCAEIVEEITEPFDFLCCAVGTGGTLAGLIAGLRGQARVLGFSSLKGGSFLNDDVRELLAQCEQPYENWQIILDYHFGGFAKKTGELMGFIQRFENRHGIPLDFIYTGKMMYGLFDMVEQHFFPEGSTIVVLHTGGVSAGRASSLDSVTDSQQREPQQ